MYKCSIQISVKIILYGQNILIDYPNMLVFQISYFTKIMRKYRSVQLTRYIPTSYSKRNLSVTHTE